MIKIKYKIFRKKGNEGTKITTKNFVKSVYDQKAWDTVLNSKYWLRFTSLKDFLLMPSPGYQKQKDNILTSLIEGKLVRIKYSDIIEYGFRKHFEIMQNIVLPSDEIVEVGCGYGLRLFSLRYQGLKNKMTGTDISENGIKSAIQINRHFNCGIDFEPMDLTRIENMGLLSNQTVYSYFSLEQLKHYTSQVITNLLQCKPKQVLHFEPVFELYDDKDLDKMKKEFIINHDYQNNLLTTLREFEKDKLLKILKVERLSFNANPFNETSFIHWVPLN